MGDIETVGIIIGKGLLEEGFQLVGGSFGRRGIGLSQNGLELQEHFLQLHFALNRIDGDVGKGRDTAGSGEIGAFSVPKGFGDGAAAGLGDILVQAALAADGKDLGQISFHLLIV